MRKKSNKSGNCFFLQYPRQQHPAPDAPQPLVLQEIHAIGRPTRKRNGEVAEAIFFAKASSLGFAVAKPWGDSERYDFILNSRRGFVSVQVKSTQRYAEGRYRVKGGGSHRTYALDEIDFLVAYIVPEDLWYIVPIAAFASRKHLRFYPRGGRNSLLEHYREAWCLLTLPRGKRGAGVLARKIRSKCRCPELAVRCAICPDRPKTG
jgi:hypothetical protein